MYANPVRRLDARSAFFPRDSIRDYSRPFVANILFLAQMQVAVGLRRHRGDFAEEGREMALVFESGAQSDFDNRQLVVGQQSLGEIDPALHEELNRRRACGLFERPCEMEWA